MLDVAAHLQSKKFFGLSNEDMESALVDGHDVAVCDEEAAHLEEMTLSPSEVAELLEDLS